MQSEIFNAVENVEVLLATSFAEASNIIRRNNNSIFAAVVDINLPDCKPGQAVQLTSSHNIPTIILTSSEDTNLKSLLLKKDVLDYITKDSHKSIVYAANFVKKMIRNSNTTALIVDDSSVYRRAFKK